MSLSSLTNIALWERRQWPRGGCGDGRASPGRGSSPCPRVPWQKPGHSPCGPGGAARNRIWHARKFFQVLDTVLQFMQIFAFCFIKLVLQEAEPCFCPVA